MDSENGHSSRASIGEHVELFRLQNTVSVPVESNCRRIFVQQNTRNTRKGSYEQLKPIMLIKWASYAARSEPFEERKFPDFSSANLKGVN